MCTRQSPGVWDRFIPAFWWRHNGQVTSQSIGPIMSPNYPLELIGIFMHTSTRNKESLTQTCRRSTNVQLWLIFCIYMGWVLMDGMRFFVSHISLNNCHDVTITTHAIKRRFLAWMTTLRQPTKRRCSGVFTWKYTFICVYWWTRQKIHKTLIVVDWYLRLMGDKTIPDSTDPCLESFYRPFVACIDLPQ